RPCVEHGHAHSVIVGNNNIDGLTEGSGPGIDSVSCSSSVPGSTCGVLHLLRSQLTYGIGLAVNLDGAVLYDGGRTVGVGSYRGTVDLAVYLNAGAQSTADASGTGDGI